MKPRVVIYDAVSVDGSIEGFEPDMGLFYEIARRTAEDATLCGCDTMLAAKPDDPEDAEPLGAPEAGDTRPLMVVVDSRGRFRGYRSVMEFGAWRKAIALCTPSTPKDHLEYLARAGVESFCCGEDHVDLGAALDWLSERFAVKVVRVESGGLLNGALLEAGLADEVQLLVHPLLVGPGKSMYRPPGPGIVSLRLIESEQFEQGAVLLRYEVVR